MQRALLHARQIVGGCIPIEFVEAAVEGRNSSPLKANISQLMGAAIACNMLSRPKLLNNPKLKKLKDKEIDFQQFISECDAGLRLIVGSLDQFNYSIFVYHIWKM